MTAKIVDLGLAKSLDEQGAQTAISIPGAFAGTPEFGAKVGFARETCRSNLRRISSPKSERVRRTWISITSLLTSCRGIKRTFWFE